MGRLDILVIIGLCLVVDTCFGLNCYKCDDATTCTEPNITANCTSEETTCYIKSYIHVPDGKEYLSMGCTNDEKMCDEDTTSGITKCSLCAEDKCNKDFSKDAASKTVCVSCDGDGCDKSDLDANTKFCTLTETNTKCVAYQYIDITQKKATTYKGCGVAQTCEAKDKKDTKVLCNECADQICNQKLEGTASTLCVECDDCKDEEVKLTNDTTFCKVDDSTKSTCYVYTNDRTTKRGCDELGTCSKQYDNDTSLVLCNQCRGNFCNAKRDTDTAHRRCVQCTGASDSDCAAASVNTSKVSVTCSLDDTVQTTCQSLAYYNDSEGDVWVHRGCAAKKNCDQSDDEVKACAECDDKDLCNKDSDLSDKKTICIKCDSTTDEGCADLDINSKKIPHFCKLDDDTKYECIGYQYSTDDKLVTVRDCVETSETNCTLLQANKTTTACVECNDDICNKKIGVNPSTVTPTTTTTTQKSNSAASISVSILALFSAVCVLVRAVH